MGQLGRTLDRSLPQHLRKRREDQHPDRQQHHPAPAGISMLGDDLSQERSRHRQQLHECQRQEDADERREAMTRDRSGKTSKRSKP